MPVTIEGTGAAAGLRIAIIRSRFNEDVTKRLLAGALDALREGGIRDDAIRIVLVPGAFEIPVVAARLARSGRFEAVICLGAVIRGDTPHFEYISAEVSRGIAQAAYDSGIPVIFGVLTTDTEEQAIARAGGSGPGACNRGSEAAKAAIEMATLLKRLSMGTEGGPAKSAPPAPTKDAPKRRTSRKRVR